MSRDLCEKAVLELEPRSKTLMNSIDNFDGNPYDLFMRSAIH